jgi:hypothetical protein
MQQDMHSMGQGRGKHAQAAGLEIAHRMEGGKCNIY